MTDVATRAREFHWLLGSFADQTAGVRAAVAVSSDGLLLGASNSAGNAVVEQLAAMVAGINSLSKGVCQFLGYTATERSIIEMVDGMLFTATIRDGSCIGVVTGPDADIGLVGYEIALLVDRVGTALTPELISHLKNSLMV